MRFLAVALAALATAPSAAAGVHIAGVDLSGYPVVRVTVVTDAATQPRLDENGLPAAGLQAVNLGRAKSVVLAVDRSQSMAGPKLKTATAAARAFIASKVAGDRVEVVEFGRDAVTLSRFSSSGADADSALAGITPDRRSGTALWDAIVLGSRALARELLPGRVIIVVTDGQDVSSTATLAEAMAAAHRARAVVYGIGIAGRGYTPGPLRELATSTGGSFLQASSNAELTSLYASVSRTIAHTWELRYVTAARPGDVVRLTAAVPGAQSATTPLRLTGVAPVQAQPSVLPSSVWTSPLAPVVLAMVVAALVLAAYWFAAGRRGGLWLRTRLGPHLGPSEQRARTPRRRQGATLMRRIVSATERAFANVGQFRALQQLLTRANVPLTAAELLYMCVGAGAVIGILTAVAGAPALFVVVLVLAAGSTPVVWVSWKARARMKAFDNQLPDLLITVAASLKAGHSFRHAIQAVVDEGAEPTAQELRRVLTETRLGRPMDDALAEMGERIGSKNFTFVLNTVTIQRQIGGSLAGLFDVVADTVRQRQQFARKIRSLTAMGRMSAYVLAGLPFGVAALISLISPTYMRPLWHSSTGHVLVGGGLASIAFGSFLLKRIVSFRG